MAHILQVGAGSGGMVVLDLLARDERIERVTLVEPDVYKPHNVHRHYFPATDVGARKADLAAGWLRRLRPELAVDLLPVDLLDPATQPALEAAAAACAVGVCAVDNEPAKYHFDALMRRAGKPWTLGEVLSGGIGGWVHQFTPGAACYGCVASHLQRAVQTDNSPPPDYSDPHHVVHEVTIPASKASIHAIASLHALWTLELVPGEKAGSDATGESAPQAACPPATAELTSLLWTLRKVPGVFEDAFRPYRFRIARNPACLICGTAGRTVASEDLDVALDQALARLGDE